MHHSIVLAGLCLSVASGCSGQDEILTCPVAQSGSMPGVLQESPEDIREAGRRLAGGDEAPIARLTAEIRRANPTAPDGAIVNYLVTAYCPLVREMSGLDIEAKREAVGAFARRAGIVVAHATN